MGKPEMIFGSETLTSGIIHVYEGKDRAPSPRRYEYYKLLIELSNDETIAHMDDLD
jgi:hypothetical protein